jgi:peptidoglycan/LPS O-acetylase OafA/YrhL
LESSYRGIRRFGLVLAFLGVVAIGLSLNVRVSDGDTALDLIARGTLALPVVGGLLAFLLLLLARRPLGRILAAASAIASLAGILILAHVLHVDPFGTGELEVGIAAIALGACLCLIRPKGESAGRSTANS